MSNDAVYGAFKDVGASVKTNVDLAKKTTFKIGGPVRYFVTVSTVDQLITVLAVCAEHDIEHFIFGGGSNMLVADEGFDGAAIKLDFDQITVDGTTIIVQAGAKTAAVARESVQAGLTGFEWGVGVPGTIGGAVRGNAGANGQEMKDTVQTVTAFVDGEVQTFSALECEFGYRHSRFKENGGIVLEVALGLLPDDAKQAPAKLAEVLQYRMETQPKGYASTGCIYKNIAITKEQKDSLAQKNVPQKFLDNQLIPAGWLVEQVGLKGETIGNCGISDVHGNFVINHKGATAAEVKQLIEKTKQRVYTEYGLQLEEEIQYIGF